LIDNFVENCDQLVALNPIRLVSEQGWQATENTSDNWIIFLNENNWTIWKHRMEDLLYCKDFIDLSKESKSGQRNYEMDWKKLNCKAIRYIWSWLEDLVFTMCLRGVNIFSVADPESLYKWKTTTNKALLIHNLVKLKYMEDSSAEKHLNKVKNIVI